MKAISVFCGSSNGQQAVYREQAFQLGQYLAQEGIKLVYGGAKVGLMGAVADGALAGGGEVIGMLPHFLSAKEIAHPGLTELILVDSMHERKQLMNEHCEGVIALPGGFGTLEELFEMLTWAQLGLHQKPIGILNIAGYYDALVQLLDHMVEQGLLRLSNRQMLLVDSSISGLVQQMSDYKPALVGKWLDENQT
ncbi:MAG: TIGR00730 family Rossman fold protein [Bacteroidota bacterium]